MDRLEAYEKWLEHEHDNKNTRRSYLTTASMFLRSQRDSPSVATAQAWIHSLIDQKVAPGTIQQRKYGLVSFFRFLEDRHEVSEGVPEKVRRTKVPKNLKKFPIYLTEEHYAKLLKAAVHPVDRAMLALMWDCALRVEELMSLEVADLTAQKGYLRIRVAKQQDGAYEYSLCPIEDRTLAVVNAYLGPDGIKTGKASARVGRGNPLIPSHHTTNFPRSMMKRLCKAAKVCPDGKSYYNPHSIRHGRAMERYRSSGYNIGYVKDFLRHKSINSTMIYAHMTAQDLKEMSDRIRAGGPRGMQADRDVNKLLDDLQKIMDQIRQNPGVVLGPEDEEEE